MKILTILSICLVLVTHVLAADKPSISWYFESEVRQAIFDAYITKQMIRTGSATREWERLRLSIAAAGHKSVSASEVKEAAKLLFARAMDWNASRDNVLRICQLTREEAETILADIRSRRDPLMEALIFIREIYPEVQIDLLAL